MRTALWFIAYFLLQATEATFNVPGTAILFAVWLPVANIHDGVDLWVAIRDLREGR